MSSISTDKTKRKKCAECRHPFLYTWDWERFCKEVCRKAWYKRWRKKQADFLKDARNRGVLKPDELVNG